MNTPLKFITDIIRPWEKLNQELTNQNSIDHSISEFINIAENLSVKLSHFPETIGKSLRANKTSIDFNIIVDIADSTKHDSLDDPARNNNLSLSSIFEAKEDGTFRFIRNKITITHNTHKQSDFLETLKKAASFIFTKLNLMLFWNPGIQEAPYLFSDKIFLNINYQNQIAWTGLKLELVQKDKNGDLVPHDPSNFKVELRSFEGIVARTYSEYIYLLFEKSIEQGVEISYLVESIEAPLTFDFFFKKNDDSKKKVSLVKIIDHCTLDQISKYNTLLQNHPSFNLILVTKTELSRELKECLAFSCKTIFLVTIPTHDAHNLPLSFFDKNYNQANISMAKLNHFRLGVLQKDEHLFTSIANTPIPNLGSCFSLDKENLIDFMAFCLSHVKPKNDKISGNIKFKYTPRDKKHIYIKIESDFVKIGLEADFDWILENTELRMPILSFNKSLTGISIWNLETYFTKSNQTHQLIRSVVKYGDTSAVGMIQ